MGIKKENENFAYPFLGVAHSLLNLLGIFRFGSLSGLVWFAKFSKVFYANSLGRLRVVSPNSMLSPPTQCSEAVVSYE